MISSSTMCENMLINNDDTDLNRILDDQLKVLTSIEIGERC